MVKLGSKTLARKTGKGGAVTVKFSAKVRRQLAKARGRKLTITLPPGAPRAVEDRQSQPLRASGAAPPHVALDGCPIVRRRVRGYGAPLMKSAAGFFTVCLLLVFSPAAQAAEQAVCDTVSDLRDGPCRTDRPLPSFWVSSTSPKAGRSVDFTAASAGRGVTFAWDFDGDGLYDDGTGKYPRQIFPAGAREIGVEATDQFGRTGTERRTIVVHTIEMAPSA